MIDSFSHIPSILALNFTFIDYFPIIASLAEEYIGQKLKKIISFFSYFLSRIRNLDSDVQ